MNKFNITRKTIIGKLLIAIPTILFAAIFYITIKHSNPNVEEGEITITWEMFLDIWLFLIVAIVLLIFAGLIYIVIKRHKFYDNGEFFVIEKGLFFKKEIKVLYKNINTIAIKRSLLDLILKTSKVEIDTGTTASPLPEGRLPLNKEYAEYLKQYLENKKFNKDLLLLGPSNYEKVDLKDDKVIYKVKNSRLLQMGIFKQGYLVTLFMVITLMLITTNITQITEPEVDDFKFIYILPVIFGVIIVTALGFMIANFIRYYNYKLIDHGDSLEYEYGLFTKTNFNFKKDRINAIYLKRSLLYRLFKRYSVEVSIIGIADFGSSDDKNQQNESRFLLPYGNFEELQKVLAAVGAYEMENTKFIKPTRNRLLKFIFIPLILPTILLITTIILTFVLPYELYLILFISIITYLLILIGLILRLRNHGVNIANKVLIQNGAFTINKVLINKNKIQTMKFNQGVINQLLKVGNIQFKYKRLLGIILLLGYDYQEFKEFTTQTFNKA